MRYGARGRDTLSRSATTQRSYHVKSMIDGARAEALLARIRRGAICLDDHEYGVLRYLGFSRRDVDRAVERLVAAGKVEIFVTSGTVRVRQRIQSKAGSGMIA